ncbi:Pyridoxamine 5 -phosphate oxidase family isoform 1 [Olea europaea subsp. europaea]|uniref:Pyridoxamine 5 -phosphate oxidase family isoform 1 n=3 Tax=Olea europaea subsp. europaea TaxID=158383 RepID=A0A8S0TI01_OLEEU|nr:Pyridoxamine 5 -phosphate oxidase family isoform 1 [Olea europaea subsp. europaea]CAA3005258.1 Pyridoxamine 5 -phosphate oxidase family isoform 1 [Olea europaea subsp. europaea]
MASLSVSSSMEAISSSILHIPKLYESASAIQSIKTSSKHCGSLKMNLSFPKKANLDFGFRVFAVGTEISDEGNDKEEIVPENDNGGFSFVTEEGVSLSQGNLDFKQSSEKNADTTSSVTTPPLVLSYGNTTGGGGTRAGLFRTPISGGVQSATSAHGLPRPALAVRNLMEQARFAHLCTVMSRMHHRREGYPFGSLVDFAPDPMGHPIFSFSPLAIHTRNLLADPRCTLVVQIPGWSGLSNARVTIFGDVYPLHEDQQEWAHKQYIAKHQQGPSQKWGNFYYFRMQNISDIYFIGGFGTVAWIDVKEYEALQPDKIAVDGGEQNLKELNAIFSKPLKELLSKEAEIDDAALISIDGKGIDIRVRQGAQFNIQRISFEEGHFVETLDEAKAALWKLIDRGRLYNLQK